ncbi:hypothetical protein BJ322DRAFT_1109051 [Thelephora terrestris]|uniref:Uncharacterized protein n=1 Tax=Thelephora terrestris TaxID=56493 RepID=A0A9P6L6F5_9AGAM|nr:hypothetical protein BJ322DRAFT_1109051 [Thelephora terrestris]
MATKVAGFYHLIGLQEKIEILKADREEGGDEEDEYGVEPREVARRKREQWRKEGSGTVLPPRPIGGPSRSGGYNGAQGAFQDFGPPPAIHRPGLARAGGTSILSQPSQTPSSLAVGLPSSSITNGDGASYREASPTNNFDWEEEQSMSISTAGPVNEGKRKRDFLDEPMMDSFDESSDGAKRQANPFAKKAEMGPPKMGLGIGSKKPAALGTQKSLHKSETFFEKVEAAETSTDPPKRGKLVKTGMKQQNLFGQPVVEDTNKGVGAKGKKKPAGKDKAKADFKKKSESPLPDGVAVKGKRSAEEPQDAQMGDDSQTTTNFDSQVEEVETQLEETQLDGSSPHADTEVETQPATETQTEEETQETQVDEDDNEPVIDWPATPPQVMTLES